MGMLSKMNEDLTITRKSSDGSTVTIKSPSGSAMDIGGMLGNAVQQPQRHPMAMNTMSGMNRMNQGGMPYIPHMNQGGYSNWHQMNQGGGMGMGSPVADDVPTMLTEGEFVMNVPATQKYKPLLEQMNQEGREMLAQGGWIDEAKPIGYKEGGSVGTNWDGYADYSVQDFLDEANNPGAGVAPAGSEFPGLEPLEGEQYPQQVVLDPTSSPTSDFDRMNALVTKGIYSIEQDRAGRAIYQLSSLGNAYNVRAQGSGVENKGVNTQGRTGPENYNPYSGVSADPVGDNAAINQQARLNERIGSFNNKGSGRGSALEASGARQDVMQFGQATDAPTVTPEGSLIQFKAGQRYNVATKTQAEQFVSKGIVAVGAEFITNDGTIGVAQ